MHAAGVTHRDIKLENIFSDAAGHPKLGDFDLAVFHHEAPTRAPIGTIFYMAPEVLLLASARGSPLEGAMQRRVSEKMDVWSLGVCLFELAAGERAGLSWCGWG
jgi:serine/threonine protein kinase